METMNVESDRKLQESLAELSEANRQMDISENRKTTQDEVFADIIYKCYKEMYANAQPSADYDVLLKLAKTPSLNAIVFTVFLKVK